MPVLGALISALFSGFAAWLAQYLSKKLVVVALAVTGFAAALIALMLVFSTVVSPIVAQLFNTQYGQFLGLAFPPAAGSCLAAIGATWSACALYKLKIQSIKMSASA
jgi:predicted PurR-regulated permease PerM